MIRKSVLFLVTACLTAVPSSSLSKDPSILRQDSVNEVPRRANPASKALGRLIEGNQRFALGKSVHPDQSTMRVHDLAGSQHPFAVVVCCSDSRVSPEIVFDEGLGDLFVVRVAGNIADDAVIGSIEYAVEHLGVPLVLVMGHEKCGAVTAAVKGNKEAHLRTLVKAIGPVVPSAEKLPGDRVENAVRLNALRVADQLGTNRPILKKRVDEGKVTIVSGYYSLDTGLVEIIPKRP